MAKLDTTITVRLAQEQVAILLKEAHEIRQALADVRCPCCGERIHIQYGDDPGEIGTLGPISGD